MTDSEIDAFVARVPEVQRRIARQKINQALSLGWTGIYFATPDGEKEHHLDLMGMHPISQRRQVLPEVSDVKE